MRSISFRTQLLMNLGTFCAVVLLLLANQTFASQARLIATTQTAPSTISYQGHLTDNAGAPINATLPMTFKLYDASDALLWTEARTGANAVPVTDGLFNVALGAVTPIDPAILGQELSLGISVGGDAEMTPRQVIGGVPVAYTVADGSVTTAKIADGAVTSNKLTPKVYETATGVEALIDTAAPLQDLISVVIPASDIPATTKALFLFEARCVPQADGTAVAMGPAIDNVRIPGYIDAYPKIDQMLLYNYHKLITLTPNTDHTVSMQWDLVGNTGNTVKCYDRTLTVILLGQG